LYLREKEKREEETETKILEQKVIEMLLEATALVEFTFITGKTKAITVIGCYLVSLNIMQHPYSFITADTKMNRLFLRQICSITELFKDILYRQ
jgi:hypothetical protein